MSEQTLPVLSEHQNPSDIPSATNPTAYTPDDQERKTLKFMQKLVDKNKKGRAPYDQKWPDYYKMFRGKQWKEQRPSYRHSEVINMIFQTIQSMVPIITDARPRIEYVPQDPSDTEFSKLMNDMIESDWIRNNWSQPLTEIVYDSHIYGTGIGSMPWDKEAAYGVGDVSFESEDIFVNYPDPNARDCNKKCLSWVKIEPVDVEILKHEYPEKAQYIKADLMDFSQQNNKMDFDQIKFKSPVEQKVTIEGSSPYDLANTDKAVKYIAWVKSYETEEIQQPAMDEATGQPVLDPMGQPQTEFVQKLKYPNLRKICMVNGMILEDGDQEYDDGKFPFARLINYQDPRNFYGISEVEQLQSPQKIFNKIISFSLDIMTLMGNPIWVVDNTSGVDTDNLVNRPGLAVEKEPGSEVRREAGLSINPDLFQLADRVRNWFNEQGGQTDVSQGVTPQGITAASAIQALQEAAQTRLRLKTRHLDAFLQDLGQLYQARILQFVSAPRMVRLTNDQNANKYFKMHVTNDEATGKKVVNIRGYTQNDSGDYTEDLETRQLIINGSLDCRVSTGSSLPFAKVEKQNKSFELFDRKIIDAEEVLKNVDYPNWEQVLQRVQGQQQMDAQAAAQGAPPPNPAA